MVRVLSAGGEGLDILNIMRLLSGSPDNLLSNNHMLPMEEIIYQDIVFGVFPLLGDTVRNAMMPFLQNCSVEDIVLIIMQALEVRQFYPFRSLTLMVFMMQAVMYIHSKNVAHRVTSTALAFVSHATHLL